MTTMRPPAPPGRAPAAREATTAWRRGTGHQGRRPPWRSARPPWLLAFVLGACLAGAPDLVHAEREVVDRIVAQVDDESILLSDVLREMNLLRLQRGLENLTVEQQEKLFQEVLDGMINDQLLVAQAKVKGFEVGEQELNQAVEQEIRSIKERLGGEENYRRELDRQGFTEAEVRDMHRESRRNQILASRVIQSDLRTQVSITSDQVREFYDTQRDSIPPELLRMPARVRLADILVIPQNDAQIQAARAKMQRVLQRLEQGEDFAQVATEMSEWPTATNGGFLGKFRAGDFGSDAFDEAVLAIEPGQLTDVIETRFGLQVIKLETREDDVMTARHIVIKTEPDQDAQVRALEKALDLRRRLLAGESFAELARQYSDDPLTRDKGGVVENEWAIDDLRPEFQAAVDTLGVGEISQVLNTPNGFYILTVLERTESRAVNFEDIQDTLHRYLEQREMEKLFRDYVAELRKKFHVDVKV